MIKYHSVVLICKDMDISRTFYQELFDLTIELEIEGLTTFIGGISLWDRAFASGLLYKGAGISEPPERPAQEIYFDTDEIDAFFNKITSRGVRLLHPIENTPWQQRTVRFFDPDDHLIEVGESMEEVIRRIAREGHTPEEVADLTFMPVEIIREVLKQN
ncbi:VOC family protein [Methanospirillum lacunae]|uniref:Glyoxalase n=1 Tax=Methanospirillum lacunae TaxID=668570 RepID=A0A2V2NE61_9EURY|nr:glyoxalase [Methanospirillum lacunae]